MTDICPKPRGGGVIGSHRKKKMIIPYHDIISVENLLGAWKEFARGKKKKRDVQAFELHLMDSIFALHKCLRDKTYTHGHYEAFNISDPKPRNIHKAQVRDRLLHHALYRILYPFFDRTFIADSYSCRKEKGMHKALQRFAVFGKKVGKNGTKTVWVLKCDVRKFFASIDHSVLLDVLKKYIPDLDILWLLRQVVTSFSSPTPQSRGLDSSPQAGEQEKRVGLPLGNLTSQLLVNIYMNEFDQFMKYQVKARYYIRYADDFVIFSRDKARLKTILLQIHAFLKLCLGLNLHPDKVFVKTLASGVNFLGWVHFVGHRVLRTATKKRMFKNIQAKEGKKETVQSYLGLLKHGNAHKLRKRVQSFL